MSVRGEERSRKRCAVRDDEVCVRRTDDARIEIYIVYLFVNFVFPRRPTERHIHTFSTLFFFPVVINRQSFRFAVTVRFFGNCHRDNFIVIAEAHELNAL